MRARLKALLLFCFITFNTFALYDRRPVVLLDAAGHAGDVGRWLVEESERSQTFKFAEELKREIFRRYRVRVVLSRSPGEAVLPLQIPSFSNRLDSKFFLRINMYREESEKPKIFLYHLLFDPLVDLVDRSIESLSLTPINWAHLYNIKRSISYGGLMFSHMNSNRFKKYFDCYPLKGMPLKYLVGITSPAVLVELGVCRENKWKNLVVPIAESLSFLKEGL